MRNRGRPLYLPRLRGSICKVMVNGSVNDTAGELNDENEEFRI
jgi:hypothetical protein